MGIITYADIVRNRVNEIKEQRAMLARGEDPRAVIPTGLHEFDKRAGIERRILTVIGAATGEGKSIFKLHISMAAAQLGYRVLLLDFEDPGERTADRSLSTVTNIDNAKILGLELSDVEMKQILTAAENIYEWGENIEFHQGLIDTNEALSIVESSDADLKQIDYAQAFPESHDKTLERTISDFAWKVNKNAQENNSANIIYSQIKSSVEERGLRQYERAKGKDPDGPVFVEGFRPFGAADLAWATALGQRGKGLGYLFRPNRYRRRFGESVKDNVMELIWPKKNFGKEGRVVVGFDGAHAKLFNLDKKTKGGTSI
jgi:replicative DNA helicase